MLLSPFYDRWPTNSWRHNLLLQFEWYRWSENIDAINCVSWFAKSKNIENLDVHLGVGICYALQNGARLMKVIACVGV